ncbi:winged helix-turn-helix transcriptional regulator [Marinicellulosiphila megalodicopiae]|uniref:winged helix-turn-helix transcriptional regulator n=1 Tax=Marinicellulosiphila megalodicopiae TaxID=2724896 RepID=UPI003BB08D2B
MQIDTHQQNQSKFIGLCSLIVQEKWNMQILSQLIDQPKRYCEIEQGINQNKNIAHISPKILSRRLKQLCLSEHISKQRFCTVPPSVQYNLTDKGEIYIPVLQAMIQVGKIIPEPEFIEDEFDLGLDH